MPQIDNSSIGSVQKVENAIHRVGRPPCQRHNELMTNVNIIVMIVAHNAQKTLHDDLLLFVLHPSH
jgi:hypothetical protein